jgi:hypothetical protein
MQTCLRVRGSDLRAARGSESGRMRLNVPGHGCMFVFADFDHL